MVLSDQLKNVARKIIESKPGSKTLRRSVRSRKAQTIKFNDDGIDRQVDLDQLPKDRLFVLEYSSART